MKYGFCKYREKPIEEGHLNLGGTNPSGERIDVNSKYLTKGGHPWLPVMGEYHFSRASKDEWYEELCKMKAGGISIVASYLFWIYHREDENSPYDFTGDLDVRSFVLAAQKAGLKVLLRLGPWAHGECRNGGFPDWLVKKPFKLRDNNEEYLELVRGWYKAIYEQVHGLLYKDGGNIIGIQLENELTDNAQHLKKLKEIAQEAGFDVPLYTVTGWNSLYGAKIPVDDVLPVFGAYPDAPWEAGTHKLPLSRHYAFYTMRNDTAIGKDLIKDASEWHLPYEKYPFATCELGPGMQSTYHRRVYISPMDAYSLSLVKLGCGNNLVGYYMFHGGTNKIGRLSTFNETKATGYPNDYPILNYDFGTCLSQYGEARESYGYLNLLHLFINDFGGRLAQMDHVAAEDFVREDDLEGLRYCMRTDGGSGFIFVNNHQRGAGLKEHRNVSFDTGCGVVVEDVNVLADSAFILPVNFDLYPEHEKNAENSSSNGSEAPSFIRLKYATAQLLCRCGNTFFFMAVDGKKAVYDFGELGKFICEAGYNNGFMIGEFRIVTLTKQEALYLRKLSGAVYLGDGVNLYEVSCSQENVIKSVETGNFSYSLWDEKDGTWLKIAVNTGKETAGQDKDTNCGAAGAVWRMAECSPAFNIEGEAARQLKLSGDQAHISWKKLDVINDQGFVVIDEEYDVIQIYCDGRLIADRYYDGAVWRVPAELMCRHECYVVMSL